MQAEDARLIALDLKGRTGSGRSEREQEGEEGDGEKGHERSEHV
jgi:hypothetical protein